jgi:2-hydroxycyclohexanecarboxyl-CoA dehydrogenase
MTKRIAFVTGGGSGIGKGISLALAEAGFHVAVADLNLDAAEGTATEITTVGGDATAVKVDVTRTASVNEAVEEFWDRILDLNFKGALRVTKAVVPGMIERGWGRVINIGSDAGRVGSSLEAVYSGAKGGIIAFTKTLAREVATTGVTANTVCPGPTDTPALRKFANNSGEDADKVISGMTRAVPMKRLGTPEDVAAAVVFFAGDNTGYITGQTLSVSGGLTMA